MTDERASHAPDAAADLPTAPDPALEGPTEVSDGGDASLLALIDRLAILLDRSDLAELEVESGGTALVLRKPTALAAAPTLVPSATASAAPGSQAVTAVSAAASAGPERPCVMAPLTGIFYASSRPVA